MLCRTSSTTTRFGDNVQTGSVFAAFAGQQCGLTTAAAKIDFFLRTTSARLGHPFRSTEAIEAFRFAPDPIEITGRTFSKRKSGIADDAVGQGSTSPMGLTVRYRWPQPLRHGFGRVS